MLEDIDARIFEGNKMREMREMWEMVERSRGRGRGCGDGDGGGGGVVDGDGEVWIPPWACEPYGVCMTPVLAVRKFTISTGPSWDQTTDNSVLVLLFAYTKHKIVFRVYFAIIINNILIMPMVFFFNYFLACFLYLELLKVVVKIKEIRVFSAVFCRYITRIINLRINKFQLFLLFLF